jgi:cytochrome o ubiquinol oxidase subunit 2
VALDWKWLFIYPKEQIATLNYMRIPEKTPIDLTLCADGSPMNSFWVPQLSGQIYAMSGMTTPLHIIADVPGVFTGRAAEINGQGFADMTFIVESTERADFDAWVLEVKQSKLLLTQEFYTELVKPSMRHPVTFYSHVDEGLFHNIVMKYE